jgi:hypothetical protein
VCNLTGFIGDIHALIEFVPQSSRPIESIDQFGCSLTLRVYNIACNCFAGFFSAGSAILREGKTGRSVGQQG